MSAQPIKTNARTKPNTRCVFETLCSTVETFTMNRVLRRYSSMASSLISNRKSHDTVRRTPRLPTVREPRTVHVRRRNYPPHEKRTNRITSAITSQAPQKLVSDTRYPGKRSVHFMYQDTQVKGHNTLPFEHLMTMNHNWHHHHKAAPSSI